MQYIMEEQIITWEKEGQWAVHPHQYHEDVVPGLLVVIIVIIIIIIYYHHYHGPEE